MPDRPMAADVARTRALATLGIAGAGLAVALIGALHLVTAGEVDPIRLTISQYALGSHRWMFNVGIVGLAFGSALIVAAVIGGGVIKPWSAGAVLAGAWVVGLVALVAFERTTWSLGPTFGGYVHRYASVVAYVALPLAALATARWGRTQPALHGITTWIRGLGIVSLLWFGVLLVGAAWWDLVPLGLIERGLALTEVAALVGMGVLARRSAALTPAHRGAVAVVASTNVVAETPGGLS